MKLNTDVIQVQPEEGIVKALTEVFKGECSPEVVVETGTYLGDGSTKVIIQSIENALGRHHNIELFTIEANKNWIPKAQNNLKAWTWVHVLHGLTTKLEAAKQWINTADYSVPEDVLVDTAGDPRVYYLTEIAPEYIGKNPEQELLKKVVGKYPADTKFMFFLDSAGGLGYFEFKTVVELMGNREYFLCCDDCNHLKHYRTWNEVQQSDEWDVLYTNGRVFVALHRGE